MKKQYLVQLVSRIGKAIGGNCISAFGIYLTIQASIGLIPWDVLGMGIAQKTSLSFGDVSNMISIVIFLITLLMKEPFGIGTVISTLLFGKVVDLYLWLKLIPEQQSLLGGVVLMLLGLLILAIGQWIYMSTGLGCGPRDSLLVALGKHFHKVPIGVIQNGVLLIVFILGWLVGGPIGVGTLISVLGMGLAMQIVFHITKFEPRNIVHEDILQTVRGGLKSEQN
jgi:uncharacterized membrane protein YczE